MTKTRTTALIAVAAGVLAAGLPVLSAQAAVGDGTPSDSNISFVGRWNRANASAYVPYWAGAYLRVGFTGKTVKLRQRNTIQLVGEHRRQGVHVLHRLRHDQPDADRVDGRQPHVDRQLPAGGRLLHR